MKVLGIVVEYNPFHNGHIYHIEKSKELINPDYTIAIMSSSFVQRGEPAIIDKWTRSELAIQYGVDLVIELPFIYSVQSADYFAKGSIELLNAIGVTDLCFGSEDGNIDTFVSIAKAIKDNEDHYNTLVKNYMNQGLRYPDACNQSLNDILGKEIRTPNDLLGLSYVKEIIFNNYKMTPHCITRTNDYHGNELAQIASASAIRNAIRNSEDISHSLPDSHLYNDKTYHLSMYYPLLKYQIMMSSLEELQSFHMVDEGLENVLYKSITQCDTMESFIDSLLSKRYTKPRIQRMLIHILMKNKKEDIEKAMKLDYVRILNMNEKGRTYLNAIKKECDYKIITNLSKHSHPALDIEIKATKLISLLNSDELITKEYAYIPYQKQKAQ